METFSAYQHAAARTGGSDLKPENRDKGLNCAAMGLAGEAGEVCDLVKKVQHLRAPLDEAKLRKELGDVLWYLAHACNVMGWNLEDIAQMNVEKLRARYPSGFSTADSIARRDEVRSWVREDSHGAVEVTVKIPGELTEAPATPRVEHNGIAVDDVVTLDDEDFRVTVSDEFGWQGVTVATTPSGRPLANVHCDWDDVERVGDRAWRTLPKRERLRTDLTEGAPASKGAKKAAKRAPTKAKRTGKGRAKR